MPIRGSFASNIESKRRAWRSCRWTVHLRLSRTSTRSRYACRSDRGADAVRCLAHACVLEQKVRKLELVGDLQRIVRKLGHRHTLELFLQDYEWQPGHQRILRKGLHAGAG